MSVQCQRCETTLPEDDCFCEVCGAALPVAHPIEDVAQEPASPCPKCGASEAEIDHEGFCAACGFRREERGRDHLEVTLSPAFAAVTDRGLRHHRNEDYLALRDVAGTAILIVCDGVSSSQDPDLASAAAAERACIALEELLLDGRAITESEMESTLAAAQESVASLPCAGSNPPATTIVAAVRAGDRIMAGWLGDSRAYWIDGEGATPITTDHSWLRDMTNSGELSEAEAQASPNAHAITRWLGVDAPQDLPAPVTVFTPCGPGKLLLCSDGLWNYAPDPQALAELVRSIQGDALTLCRGLVDFARSNGGNDNITVAVLSVDESTS